MADKGNSEETGQLSCQLDKQQGADRRSNPGPDTKEKSESNSESKEKQKGPSGDSSPGNASKVIESPLNIQKPEEKQKQEEKDVTIDKNEDQDQEKNSNLQSQITVPGSNSPSGDSSPGNASKKVTETAPHSDTQVDGKKGSKPEGLKKESPLNIQKSEEEQQQKQEEKEEQQKQEEKEVTIDKNEDQDQDKKSTFQPQITVPGSNKTVWICAVGVILLAVVCAFMCSLDSTPPVPNQLNVVDVFNQEMKKLENGFPNQHPELWRRSLIHLRRHLKAKNPTEPVSLILTSGYRAEKTLGCLAQCLAEAFSTALNSSVLNINGKDKASQDSDQVKLDIDSELKKAFEGKKSAAVVHRFEELPPGSTLIFYRYCDHENAAYKNVFLAFTVMLDAEVEVPSNVNLGRVEEMVQDHIKHKFVSSDKSAMFNQMDVDKLSGLWSRISHLILPVAAEEKIEQQGCEDYNKSF